MHLRTGVVALALVLPACAGTSSSGVGATGPTPAPTDSTSQVASRCSSGSISARVGSKAPVPGASGQFRLTAVFTNTGGRPCTLHGYPTVVLRGPADPNGRVYRIAESPGSARTVRLRAGGTAEAVITYLKSQAGDIGSLGSKNWIPTTLVITLPGDQGRISVGWPSSDPVLRQDEATHPGTYVGPVLPGRQ